MKSVWECLRFLRERFEKAARESVEASAVPNFFLHFSICACHPGYGAHAKSKRTTVKKRFLAFGISCKSCESARKRLRAYGKVEGAALIQYTIYNTRTSGARIAWARIAFETMDTPHRASASSGHGGGF